MKKIFIGNIDLIEFIEKGELSKKSSLLFILIFQFDYTSKAEEFDEIKLSSLFSNFCKKLE